jgi:diphthamide biosynthesis protein 7
LDNGNPEDTLTLYSGGDDSALRLATCSLVSEATAIDSETAVNTPFQPVKFDGHGAGVTAILPLAVEVKDGSGVVLTGSYDDHIRVWAIKPLHRSRGIRNAQILAQSNLGGGVWRLKLIDLVDETKAVSNIGERTWATKVLASCMHAGPRIIEVSGDDEGRCQVNVLGRVVQHKSMNYGCDYQPGRDGKLLCVSTSFYDKLLCLWRY